MASTAEYNLANRLREIRLRHGETIEEVAKSLRISAGSLSNIELGRAAPSLALLAHLARHFHISIAKFFEEGPLAQPNAAEAFFREFGGSLDRAQWDVLATVARALVENGQTTRAPS